MKKKLGMFFGVLCLSMLMTAQVFATELSDETQDQITQEVVTEVKGATPSFDNLSPGVNSVTVDGVTKKVLADENGVLIQKPAGTWYQYYGYSFYYEEANYLAFEKLLTIGGVDYYFDYFARMCTGSFDAYDATQRKYVKRLADANGAIVKTPGWYYYVKENEDDERGWYYIQKDGTLLAKGIYEIDGTEYGFMTNGQLAIGGYSYYENNKYVGYLMDVNGVVIRTSGWHQIDAGSGALWYYVQDNGTLLRDGVYTVNGKKYYFNWYGEMATGKFSVYDNNLSKSVYWFAKEDGELITTQGWYQIYNGNDKGWYYVQNDGTLLVDGIYTINGKNYYFSEHGNLITGRVDIYNSSAGKWEYRITKPDGELITNGWYYYIDSDYPYNGGWYYVKDGMILINGIHTIYGNDYYLNRDGVLQIGSFIYKNRYYITDENGAIIKTPGWHQVDGFWYYIQSNGELIENGIHTIHGKRYAFSLGIMQKGNAYIYDSNAGEHVGVLTDENGVILENEVGWYQRDGKWYYFKSKGSIASDELLSIHGNDYYFDDYGIMAVGYVYDNWYVRYVANSQGVIVKNNWVQYGQNWYYADVSGRLVVDNWVEIGDSCYYMDEAGAMVTGYYWIDGCLYRFADSGACMVSLGDFVGWKQVNGIWYYFKEKGVSYDGWVDNTYYVEDSVMRYQTPIDWNGNTYYLDKNGKKVFGWYQDGTCWYYGKADGVLAETEWVKIGDSWYYFDHNNLMVTDLVQIDNEKTGSLELHRFTKDGVWCGQIIETSKWIQGKFFTSETDEEKWFYFDECGYWNNYGKVKINGVEYFFEKMLCTDRFVSDGKKCYYVNKNGVEEKLSVGWNQIRGSWCYVKSNGEVATGLQTINGKKYYFVNHVYFDDSYYEIGPLLTTGYVWVHEYGKYCFFGSDGAMITPTTGWYSSGKNWYYFKNGAPVNGFQTINGATYYFENNYMQIGGVSVESADAIYVFDANGKLVKNQWTYVNGKWYYADAKGRALTGEHVIGGKKYIFKEDGVMIS